MEEKEKKQEKTAKIVYIVMAAVVALTMVISIISAVTRRKSEPETIPQITEAETDAEAKPDTGAVKQDPLIIKPSPSRTDDKVQEKPKPAETEPEPDGKNEAQTISEKVYVIPVNGSVIKDYTMDLPVYSVTMNDYRVHNGIDITAEKGTPVHAFTDGTVSKIYFDPLMGQTVEIDHGEGLVSVYQNLQITLPDGIEAGAEIKAGDIIGAAGETALVECAEVSHIHFSLMKNGVYEAPASYIGSIQSEEE